MILGLLGFSKCSDTGDWPEAEFSFPCDIFCFEGNKGTFFRSIAQKAQAFTVDVNYNTNFSFTVPEGEYLLLGDDRLVSSDSRHVGTFKAKIIRSIVPEK
ncbi:signal peptidase I [Streptococcus pneumoniae]|nr:signal peptidase I [Streptococcus pneumoniae]